ncbi:succinate-semialdehyde dehydrogenase [NADP+] GabD, partial [Vibrio parahaemolyticus VPTS-2010]
RVHC